MSEITSLSAFELSREVRAGRISASLAVREYLCAIDKIDGEISAYNEVFPELAISRAESIDDAVKRGENPGLLCGVPIAIKDNLCTSFGRTTCSSKILSDFSAPYTSTAVKNLISAGAIIIGKTNMDEFAMGSSTENSSSKPTLNPWDTSRVPGGSSGGSAAAVAAKMCAAALGSDTGGSIRQPAAFCGVVGFKPTYGRVSRYGLVAFGSSLDQIGPITRDVRDCALMTQVISGHDGADSTSVDKSVPDYLSTIDTPLENLRIGLPKEFFDSSLDGEIAAVVDNAIEVFKSLGAKIVDVSLPHSRIDCDENKSLSSYAVACYYIIATAEASSNLARYDGVHYGHRTNEPANGIVEMYSKTRAEGFGDEVIRRIMLGTYALSSGYYDAYYLKAMKVRRLIKNDFDRALENCDILLSPTTPSAAFKIGEKINDPLQMYLADIYTISLNLAGIPGISIPAGLTGDKLPVGVQLAGGVFSEEIILRAAKMFEKSRGADILLNSAK